MREEIALEAEEAMAVDLLAAMPYSAAAWARTRAGKNSPAQTAAIEMPTNLFALMTFAPLTRSLPLS